MLAASKDKTKQASGKIFHDDARTRVTYRSCLVDLRAEREDGNDDDGGGVVRVLVNVPQHHTEHLEDVERVETLKQCRNNT